MGFTISGLAEGRSGFGKEFRTRDPDGAAKSYNQAFPSEKGGRESVFDSGLMSPSALMDESTFQEQDNLFSDPASNNDNALFNDDNPNESTLDVLTENSNIDFAPVANDVGECTIDVTKAETHAAIKSDKVNNYIEDTEEKMDQLKTFWDDHQAVAQEYLEAAVDNIGDQIGLTSEGISKGDVVKQIMPQGQTGKAGAATQAAVPGVAAYEIGKSVAEERKDLSRDQKRALIEEMVKIAQSKPELDSEKLGKVLSPGANTEEIQENLARLSSAKMEKLITESAEDQPEFKALEQSLDTCYEVKENQFYARDHYHDNPSMDKIFALANTGDNVVNFALNDSMEYRFTASQMNFAGEFLKSASLGDEGGTVTARESKIDTGQLAGIINQERLAVHMPRIQEALHASMQVIT